MARYEMRFETAHARVSIRLLAARYVPAISTTNARPSSAPEGVNGDRGYTQVEACSRYRVYARMANKRTMSVTGRRYASLAQRQQRAGALPVVGRRRAPAGMDKAATARNESRTVGQGQYMHRPAEKSRSH